MRRVSAACGLLFAAGALGQIDLRVVAAAGDPVPGSSYTFGVIPTEQAVITDAGYVFFDAHTIDDEGIGQYTTLAIDLDGDFHIVARGGSNVRGLPAGVTFTSHGSDDIIPAGSNSRATLNIGQTELLWPATIRLNDGTLQDVWLEWNEQDGTTVFLEFDQVIALNGEPWQVRVDRPDRTENTAQFDALGGRAFQMRIREPGATTSQIDAVVRWTEAGGFEPMLVEGDPWDDLGEGGMVTGVGRFTLNPDGSAFIEAGVQPPTGAGDTALVLVQPDGTGRTGPFRGRPLPSLPDTRVDREFISSVDFGAAAQLFRFVDLQTNSDGMALVQRLSDGTERLLARSNHPDPRLPDGQIIALMTSLPRTDGLGNVVASVFLGDTSGQMTRQGYLGFTPDGQIHEVLFVGDTLPNGGALQPYGTRAPTVLPGGGGQTSLSASLLIDGPEGVEGAAWVWDGATTQLYAWSGATIPGPTDPNPSAGYRPLTNSLSVEASGDIVFDASLRHGGGLRVRSTDGSVRLLTFEEQRWTVQHGGESVPLRDPIPATTRGSGFAPRLQHEGPDAVGPGSSVLMYWRREIDNGGVLTLVSLDPCPADVNDDGEVSPSDFNAWINAYNSNNPACDQNGDGECRPNDFSAWILNFNAGCP